MQFDLGTTVYTDDGVDVGTVDRIVLRDAAGDVLGLVVHKGIFFARDVLVPMEVVARVSEMGVHLTLTKGQVEGLPDFIEEEYAVPMDTQVAAGYAMGGMMFPMGVEPGVAPMIVTQDKHLPPGAGDIAHGYTVYCGDQEVGIVHDVVANEGGSVEYLLITVEGIARGEVRIPIALISSVENETVALNCTLADLQALA